MKKFSILSVLLILVLFTTGCSTTNESKQSQEEEEWDIEELFAEIEREEEEKLKPICEQDLIPAEYAKDCFFRELKDCKSNSDALIPREDLNKCLPVFLQETIEEEMENFYY